MHYPFIIKSNVRSAPDCIMQRIQLTADKTQANFCSLLHNVFGKSLSLEQ